MICIDSDIPGQKSEESIITPVFGLSSDTDQRIFSFDMSGSNDSLHGHEILRYKDVHRSYLENAESNTMHEIASNRTLRGDDYKSISSDDVSSDRGIIANPMLGSTGYNLSFLFYPNLLKDAVNMGDEERLRYLSSFFFDDNCMVRITTPAFNYDRKGHECVTDFYLAFLKAQPDLLMSVHDIKTSKGPDCWFVECPLRYS